jgi:hypothetical protein
MTLDIITTNQNNKINSSLPIIDESKVTQTSFSKTMCSSRSAFSCQNSPTFGDLVEVAYNKNAHLLKPCTSSPMSNRLLHYRLWTNLQATFFAPGVDAATMSKCPAHSFEERHASCGCPYNITLTKMAGRQLHVPIVTYPNLSAAAPRWCSSVLVQTSSHRPSHPLASCTTVRATPSLVRSTAS